MSKTEPAGRLARWALKIQEFDIVIGYRPGKSHQNADTLSRTPIVPVAKIETRSTNAKTKTEVKYGKTKEEQNKACTENMEIDRWINHQNEDEYCGKIIRELETGNPREDIRREFAISSSGILIDSQCRRVVPKSMILVNKIFTKYGSPEVVLTDQGTNFLSSLIEEVCKLFKIRRIRTTAYHPQTDGLVERFNRTLCDMLACYVADEPEKWDKYLPFVTFAYNTAKQASIRETPFYLFFGREPIMPNDIKINRRYETYEDTSMMYSHQWEKDQKLAREHLFKAETRQKK
ncbi:putative integrase core domain protein [Daphnia sinensis]|uniref:Integrase core domain protein n=1 Tax=Daphnia sinensis TaxID=1820382 RepID=A0AAD5L222_9CRUS|nr:putative integrase core domain protein [Daphnia sinensis]